jgi:hypothetical protein
MNIQESRHSTHRWPLGVLLVLGGSAIVSLTLHAQAANMRPGQYEMTSEMAMAGRAMKMPARKEVQCITAEDLKDWSRKLVQNGQGTTCKLVEYKPAGATLTFTRVCTTAAGGQTTYRGNVTFTPPDTYRAVVSMKDDSGRSTNPLMQGSTITTTAKRVGACTN